MHHAYTNRSILAAALACASSFFTAATTEAATITWGAATGIAGDGDVSTNGALVAAFNLGAGGVGNTTVNGVAFTGLAVTGASVTSGDFTLSTAGTFASNNFLGSANPPFTSLSAPYQTLLSSAALIAGNGSITLTISNLTVGQSYVFQWWNNSSNGTLPYLTTAAAGNSVTLSANTTAADGGVGEFAIGTFIADNAAQTITFSGSEDPGLNGFQLREIAQQIPPPGTAVPEPGSALVGMLALGLCGARFSRRGRR